MDALPPAYDGPLFEPVYRPFQSGDWSLRNAGPMFVPGYWSEPRLAMAVPALVRRGKTWMSLTPLEMESQEIGVRNARGHVLVCGLGMGWAAAAAAALPQVERVTVVEVDADVVALHEALDVFAQVPGGAGAKVRIVHADAFAYRADSPVDLLMPDIWLPLVSDGRVEEVRRMHGASGAAAVYFWGQELELVRHAAAAGRTLDDEGLAATASAWDLPLVGPGTPGYAARAEAAARRWLRGRWLPGTSAPF